MFRPSLSFHSEAITLEDSDITIVWDSKLDRPLLKWDLNLKINKHLTGPFNDPIFKSTILFCSGLQANLVILGDSRRTTFFPTSNMFQILILSFNPWKSTTAFAQLFSFFWSAKTCEYRMIQSWAACIWGMVIPSWMGVLIIKTHTTLCNVTAPACVARPAWKETAGIWQRTRRLQRTSCCLTRKCYMLLLKSNLDQNNKNIFP